MRKIITLLLFSWFACVSQASIQNSNGENASDRYRSPRRNTTPAESMTVDGRTWWYETDIVWSDTQYDRTEIGLTIDGIKEINGQTWHVIKVRQIADIDFDDKAHPFKFESPVAYIRQDGNKVYVMSDNTCTPTLEILTNTDNPHFVYQNPTLIYGYGNVGDVFTLYEGQYFPLKYKIIEVTNSTESTPTLYKCEAIIEDPYDDSAESQQFTIAEGIGITSTGNIHCSVFGNSDMFFAPFGGATSAFKKYRAPRLRYVTDGEDNTVIYTGEGGYQLWKNYGAVESVLPDADGTDDEADVHYYNLQGQPVPAPIPGTVTIRRTPTSVTKIRTR